MTVHPSNPSGAPSPQGAKQTHFKKSRREDIDNFLKILGKMRPSDRLIALIKGSWTNGAFRQAIEEMAPMKKIPRDIMIFLKAKSANNEREVAFLRVAWAQADKQFDPVYQIPGWPFNDPATTEKFIKDINEATKRNRPKGWRRQRVGNKGIIDPSYDWYKNSPHKHPDLAEGLGMTPAGLRKRCRNRGIPIIASKIPHRAGTIAAKHARILLKEQLEKPVNKARDMETKCKEAIKFKQLRAVNQAIGATA